MAKKHRNNAAVEHGRGVINDNAIKALVTSPMFSMRVVKAKKGKGAYQRYKKGQDYNDSAFFYAHRITPPTPTTTPTKITLA
jgi:alternative ribosome-rescue factor